MKKYLPSISILAVFVLGALYGGSHYSRNKETCRLLDIAQQEAEMSEAWYLQTGKVLARCGIVDAKETAERKACFARRRQNAQEVCE